MAEETKIQAEAAAQAPANIAETVAKTAEKVVAETATVAKRERAKTARRVKREATARKTVAWAAAASHSAKVESADASPNGSS